MANYKVIFEGNEEDEVFSSYEEAESYAQYLVTCYHDGGEILEMSNPEEYPYDSSYEPEYEIVETDEAIEEPDEDLLRFQRILNTPGVFDDEHEFVRCPNCGTGLHYYNGGIACPKCGLIE